MANGILLPGGWCYKLANPLGGQYPYLPIDTHQIADLLEVSERTATRICSGERKLRSCEILHLQIKLFGVIPDPQFMRYRFYIKDGVIRTNERADFEISAGEMMETALLGQQYRQWYFELSDKLRLAQVRLEELTNPPKPSNIIDFKAAARRKGRNLDEEA